MCVVRAECRYGNFRSEFDQEGQPEHPLLTHVAGKLYGQPSLSPALPSTLKKIICRVLLVCGVREGAKQFSVRGRRKYQREIEAAKIVQSHSQRKCEHLVWCVRMHCRTLPRLCNCCWRPPFASAAPRSGQPQRWAVAWVRGRNRAITPPRRHAASVCGSLENHFIPTAACFKECARQTHPCTHTPSTQV